MNERLKVYEEKMTKTMISRLSVKNCREFQPYMSGLVVF